MSQPNAPSIDVLRQHCKALCLPTAYQIVEQALDTADGGSLVDEVRESHLDVALLRLESLGHFPQHSFEGIDANLFLVVIEDLHEAGHVRALEVMGQVHVHVEGGYGVLFTIIAIAHPHRMADILDADPVDGDASAVCAGLDIGDGRDDGRAFQR